MTSASEKFKNERFLRGKKIIFQNTLQPIQENRATLRHRLYLLTLLIRFYSFLYHIFLYRLNRGKNSVNRNSLSRSTLSLSFSHAKLFGGPFAIVSIKLIKEEQISFSTRSKAKNKILRQLINIAVVLILTR